MSVVLTLFASRPPGSLLSHEAPQTFARNLPISHRTLYLISNTSKIILLYKSLLPLKPFPAKLLRQLPRVLWSGVCAKDLFHALQIGSTKPALLLLNSTKERVWLTQSEEVLPVSILIVIQSVNLPALFTLAYWMQSTTGNKCDTELCTWQGPASCVAFSGVFISVGIMVI